MKKMIKKVISLFIAVVMTVTATVIPVSAEGITLPKNAAMTFVNDMGAGWNLGNSFDSHNCTWLSNKLDYESGWCGVKASKALIKTVKDAGFDTIRIPVTWYDHVDQQYNIDSAWMDRVAEVTDWCLAENLYVILDVHHDVLHNRYYPSSSELAGSTAYLKKVWEQIAAKFKNYSSKVIFEPINEPRLIGTNYEWWYDRYNVPAEVKDSLECINKLNQTALDAIRASGGNNASRYVLVGGYDTDGTWKGALSQYFRMPTDTVSGKLILDAHIYGTSKLDELQGLYEGFTSKGIPVVISEYGLDSDGYDYIGQQDTAARIMKEFGEYARERGISVWDNNSGSSGQAGHKFIDRASASVVAPKAVSAFTEANKPAKSNDPLVPVTPKVKATAGDGKVTLTWDAVDGAERYSVLSYEGSGYKTLTSKITKTTYTIQGLTNGKKYQYVVRSNVGGQWSTYTDSDRVSVTPSTTRPAVTATAGDSSVTLTWNAVNGAQKYAVYSYDAAAGYKALTSKLTKTTYTVRKLTNGVKYEYLVRAYVDGKWSAYTDNDRVSATPVLLRPDVKAAAGDGFATLTWDAVQGAEKYAVYSYDAAAGYKALTSKLTGTSYTVKNLTNGTNYGFLVRAYVNGKWSTYSDNDRVYVTPVSSKPAVTVNAGSGYVILRWNEVANAEKYAVYTYDAATDTCTAVSTRITKTNYKVTKLTNGTTYSFIVRAYVNGKWSTYTANDAVSAVPHSL